MTKRGTCEVRGAPGSAQEATSLTVASDQDPDSDLHHKVLAKSKRRKRAAALAAVTGNSASILPRFSTNRQCICNLAS